MSARKPAARVAARPAGKPAKPAAKAATRAKPAVAAGAAPGATQTGDASAAALALAGDIDRALNEGRTDILSEAAVQALFLLRREFPHDPEALYISTHYFSEMGNRAAQELAATGPNSYQAHELEAEAFESQGKWPEAAAEYQKILEQNPNVPGIHFRLGRVALSSGESEANTEEARKEFDQELKIDPTNAAAEFSLGEISRRAGQWDDAIAHFSAAAKLDSGFAEAFLALGMSLVSAQRFAEAVNPLEKYVKIVPGDPAGHYQLAIAYDRTGHKEAAAREMQLQREAAAKAPGGDIPH